MLGSDGYIGFPLVQYLLLRGHEVYGVDAFYRQSNVLDEGLDSIIPIASPNDRFKALNKIGKYQFKMLDIAKDYEGLAQIFKDFKPEAIINLAQIPSAPFSMQSPQHATWTISNNVNGTMNVLWAMRKHCKESSLVILGSMGVYGFPKIDIAEGFFKVDYHSKSDVLPFPYQTGSIYHSSKAMSGILDWFAARIFELRISEVEQGIIYGTKTDTMTKPELMTRFDIGEQHGTFLNRAVACAVIGNPILVYGSGLQQRAYIQLRDSIKCLTLLAETPPSDDDSLHGLRIVNQFDDWYSCNSLASLIQTIGNGDFNLDVEIEHIENPRVEPEYHYYNPVHEKLYKMGWKPEVSLVDGIREMIEDLLPHKKRLLKYKDVLLPKIKWRK